MIRDFGPLNCPARKLPSNGLISTISKAWFNWMTDCVSSSNLACLAAGQERLNVCYRPHCYPSSDTNSNTVGEDYKSNAALEI